MSSNMGPLIIRQRLIIVSKTSNKSKGKEVKKIDSSVTVCS